MVRKKSAGGGMLEGPAPGVLAERLVEHLRSEDLVAQRRRPTAGFT